MSDAMGDETYSTTGGALKLKGVVGSRVDKKKRRKKKVEQDGEKKNSAKEVAASDQKGEADDAEQGEEPTTADERSAMSSKTEAERRFEEMKRQRIAARVKHEGMKTHKERVEELNRYLSNLSEHHDMPRIGPG